MKRHTIAAATAVSFAALFAFSAAAAPGEVVPSDPMGRPESIAVAPDGTVYLGSSTAPVVYRAKKGAATADVFIDMRADKSASLLGVLTDAPSNTLWVCEIKSMDRTAGLLKGDTVLRAFDLASGAAKASYPLPGPGNICNDFVVGADKALYVSDTSNGKILRLKPGAQELELVLQDPALFGVDGITFLNGTLYVNTVWSNNLYRIPMDANGKASAPVQLQVSQLLLAPDGMRAANGKMFVAENRAGRVDMVTINGDKATVTTIKSGLNAPTAVEPAGDTLWIGDRAAGKAIAMPMPK